MRTSMSKKITLKDIDSIFVYGNEKDFNECKNQIICYVNDEKYKNFVKLDMILCDKISANPSDSKRPFGIIDKVFWDLSNNVSEKYFLITEKNREETIIFPDESGNLKIIGLSNSPISDIPPADPIDFSWEDLRNNKSMNVPIQSDKRKMEKQ